MSFKFEKWSANGNHFVVIDQRSEKKELKSQTVKTLCHPVLGVGADGVIEIFESLHHAFKFTIWNSDGSVASMCGNAARIVVHRFLENNSKSLISFEAPKAIYEGKKEDEKIFIHMVERKILPSLSIEDEHFVINTGVPHIVLFKKEIKELDLNKMAPPYRHHSSLEEGYNVDWVEIIDEKKQTAFVRIFERGVEGETWSCGTGMSAVAWALHEKKKWNNKIILLSKGGEHEIRIEKNQLWFAGEVKKIFIGEWIE
jgi:diaminopimelate epimerase